MVISCVKCGGDDEDGLPSIPPGPLANSSAYCKLAYETYYHKDYGKMTIPVKNVSRPLVVEISMGLRKILEIDEFKQLAKVSVWVREFWTDEFLQWDPNDYEGVRAMRVKHNSIWTPDMLLYTNGGEDTEPLDHINAIVSYDGQVTYMYPALYHVACHMAIQ